MPGSRPRSGTCSPRSPRAGRPTGWSRRSPLRDSRCAPTAARVGGAAAVGVADPRPGAGDLSKNPGYAGAYAFGRYASHRTVDPSGTVHTAMAERPRAEWPVLIKDHHEGYITWADYLASEARLAANHTAAGAWPPREGTALCQGIIGCGSCGEPVITNYHTDQRPAYECSSRRDRLTTPSCRSVAAACVDAAVAGALLDALTPGQVALARQPPARSRAGSAGQPGGRAGRRARPLRRRPGRAGVLRRRAGEPAGRPLPGGAVGGQARRPRRSRAGAPGRPGHAAAAAGTTWKNSPLTCPPVERAGHQRPGPQAAAAHPDRRRHPAARTRPQQSTDRDPLAHRRHRRAHRRQARLPGHRQANPGRRGRTRQTAGPPPATLSWSPG